MDSIIQFADGFKSKGDGLFTLTVNSDTHYSGVVDLHKEILATSAIIAEQTSDALINLGDFIRGYEDRSFEEMKADMSEAVALYQKNTNVPVLLCKGNQDDGTFIEWLHGEKSIDNVITPPIMYSKMIEPFKARGLHPNPCEENSMYYYIDFPDKKVRVYVLNCTDIPYKNDENGQMIALGQWCYGYATKQI